MLLDFRLSFKFLVESAFHLPVKAVVSKIIYRYSILSEVKATNSVVLGFFVVLNGLPSCKTFDMIVL